MEGEFKAGLETRTSIYVGEEFGVGARRQKPKPGLSTPYCMWFVCAKRVSRTRVRKGGEAKFSHFMGLLGQ